MTDVTRTSQNDEVSESELLVDMILGIRSLTERIVETHTADDIGEGLDEAWLIANSRFHMLARTVRKLKLGDDVEDELIALGLVGPEMRFREEVLAELIDRSGSEPTNLHSALRLGVTVLRTLSQLPDLAATIEATIGFCEGLIAHEELAVRESNR
jgi:hypothetical protein